MFKRMITVGMAGVFCLALAAAQPVPKCRYAGDGYDDGRPAVRWRGFNLLEMFY